MRWLDWLLHLFCLPIGHFGYYYIQELSYTARGGTPCNGNNLLRGERSRVSVDPSLPSQYDEGGRPPLSVSEQQKGTSPYWNRNNDTVKRGHEIGTTSYNTKRRVNLQYLFSVSKLDWHGDEVILSPHMSWLVSIQNKNKK
jgi:hypothetical protein